MNYLFLNRNFALKIQRNCWKDDVLTFSAYLSVTIKRLTRYTQKVALAAMLEGARVCRPTSRSIQIMLLLLKNQSAIKYLRYMRFLSNFGCKIIFVCSVNFGHQQDSTPLFKGITWPLSPSGLFVKFLFKIRHGTMNSLIESLWDLQISNNFARFC